MGRTYKYGENHFRDYLMAGMQYGADISDVKNIGEVTTGFIYILEYLLPNKKDAVYLDFKITKKEKHYKVVALNFISALWLSGIFPENTDTVIRDNKFELENILYKYDKRSKKLKYKSINE